jgi:hypothetical protein
MDFILFSKFSTKETSSVISSSEEEEVVVVDEEEKHTNFNFFNILI